MQRHAGDLVRRLDALDQRRRLHAVEEVYAVTCGHIQHAATHATAFARRVVQLAGPDCAFDGELADCGPGPQIPPPDPLVFGGGNQDVAVGSPHDGFDCAAVDTGPDLVTGRCGG